MKIKTEPSIKKHPEQFLGMVSLGVAIGKVFDQDDFNCAAEARNAVKTAFRLGWIREENNHVVTNHLPKSILDELEILKQPTISIYDLICFFESQEIKGGANAEDAYFDWKQFNKIKVEEIF